MNKRTGLPEGELGDGRAQQVDVAQRLADEFYEHQGLARDGGVGVGGGAARHPLRWGRG